MKNESAEKVLAVKEPRQPHPSLLLTFKILKLIEEEREKARTDYYPKGGYSNAIIALETAACLLNAGFSSGLDPHEDGPFTFNPESIAASLDSGKISVNLNPEETVNLWAAGTAQAIQQNPRATPKAEGADE